MVGLKSLKYAALGAMGLEFLALYQSAVPSGIVGMASFTLLAVALRGLFWELLILLKRFQTTRSKTESTLN
jgi:hypothetical protein